jgi:hypothetical protein
MATPQTFVEVTMDRLTQLHPAPAVPPSTATAPAPHGGDYPAFPGLCSPAGLGASGHDRPPEGVPAGIPLEPVNYAEAQLAAVTAGTHPGLGEDAAALQLAHMHTELKREIAGHLEVLGGIEESARRAHRQLFGDATRSCHVGTGDLIGAVITDAYVKDSTVHLSLRGREGRRFHVAVMSDPEGNGPGSLHVSDTQLMTFLGALGGRS